MKTSELTSKCKLEIVNSGEDKKISGVYCCDLLSVVMSKAFAGCAWVTVMANINSVAVATLADISCIVLCETGSVDEKMLFKAEQQNINIFKSNMPVFETALAIHEACKGIK